MRQLSLAFVGSILALAGVAHAVTPGASVATARMYHGTFRNAAVVLTLAIDDTGTAYSGSIALKGQTFPIASATAAGPMLSGTFRPQGGGEFPFTVQWEDFNVIFRTGSSTMETLTPDAAPTLIAWDADPDRQTLEQANTLIDAKRYDEVRTLIAPLVAKNSPRALFLQGVLDYWGWGGPQNFDAAVASYRRAAALGESTGLRNAGLALEDGDRAPKDPVAARGFFADGVRLGDAPSAVNLGVMYVNGEGGPRDFVKGYCLYALADNEQARKNMAELEAKYMKPEQVAMAKSGVGELRRLLFPQANKPQPAQAKAEPVPVEFAIDATGHAVVKTKPTAKGFEDVQVDDVLVRLNDHENIGVVTADQLAKIVADGAQGEMIRLELKRGDSSIQVITFR